MWHVKNKDNNNNNNRCTQLQLLNLQNLSGSHLVGGVALSTPARYHPDSNFDGVSAIGIILIGIIPPLIYIKSNFVLTLGQLDTSLHLCKVKEADSYKLDFTKKGQRIKKMFISQFIKKKDSIVTFKFQPSTEVSRVLKTQATFTKGSRERYVAKYNYARIVRQ